MGIDEVERRANHYLGKAKKPGPMTAYDKFYFCMADTGLELSDKAMREIYDIAKACINGGDDGAS